MDYSPDGPSPDLLVASVELVTDHALLLQGFAAGHDLSLPRDLRPTRPRTGSSSQWLTFETEIGDGDDGDGEFRPKATATTTTPTSVRCSMKTPSTKTTPGSRRRPSFRTIPWVLGDSARSPPRAAVNRQSSERRRIGATWWYTQPCRPPARWGGCCGNWGPTNRWRSGILLRASLDDDQDEGYHGYRCAIASNAETVGGIPHSGDSIGQFLQLSEFMDWPRGRLGLGVRGAETTPPSTNSAGPGTTRTTSSRPAIQSS